MSFSSDVKKELAGQISAGRHCRLAELAAIISYAGKIRMKKGSIALSIETDNPLLKEKYEKLLALLFKIELSENELMDADVLKVLESVKMWD